MISNIQLIFNKENEGNQQNFVPKMDIDQMELDEILPASLLRKDLPIPNIPEINIVRHFIRLSNKNYGVDTGIYPLGS
ncbi:MAG: aminomethyl-transferring glycine dehydrogenase subunit GcvPB, partial [Candidatus Lokiarchaeota archaeon]|nr:aminomethyl-transferring glycine dehydrogenase subunit GcvPB [Candidatus Lokiarchaeota archaeon]